MKADGEDHGGTETCSGARFRAIDQKVAKQQSELGEIVAKHREFKQIEKDLAGAHQMFVEAEDAEMKQMAQDEEKELTARKETTERELKLLLLPRIQPLQLMPHLQPSGG